MKPNIKDYSVEDYLNGKTTEAALGVPFIFDPPEQLKITDYYKFSGFTLSAWLEAMDISKSTWEAYSQGRIPVPDYRMDKAHKIALSVKATCRGTLSVSDSLTVRKIRDMVALPEEPKPAKKKKLSHDFCAD
jgi:hypothetical protein